MATSSVLRVLPLFLLVAASHSAQFTITNKVPVHRVGGGRAIRRDFDGAGNGRCGTGDCGGVLQCTQYGQAPNTLAEFGLNQYEGQDFIDISVVDGFNVPLDFLPADGTAGCPKGGPRCDGDITAQCPAEFQAPGGCNNACTVFKEDQYCCTGSAANSCGPTDYSRFFKGQCPDAYSYPKDDATSIYTCPGGTNYQVIFCP
ncbi:hypothetical protein QYE76_058672 [Lolium multiflorum]|uniref:Thaumatin-like protein n=1 Tax=Lolium multiflorum TaxID=4521 RepID=A0AAD8T5Y2_LOLMU|nr:hypothetical protein QYE76_058672 [Lolium multiflorum]